MNEKGGLARWLLTRGVGSTAIRVFGTLLSGGLVLVLARLMGAEEYGRYAYALAVVGLLSIPGQFGLPLLVVKETAAASEAEDQGRAIGVLRWALGLALVMSSFVALAAAGIFESFKWKPESPLREAMLLVPLVCLVPIVGAAIRGHGRVRSGQVPEKILKPLSTIAFVLGVWGITGDVDSRAAIYATVVATLTALGISVVILRGITSTRRYVKPIYSQKEWLGASIPFAMMAGLYSVNQEIDVLILGIWHSDADVGTYRVATKIAMLALFVQQSLVVIVAPQFSRLYASGRTELLEWLVKRAARASVTFAAAVTILLIVAAPFALPFVGHGFVSGYIPLVILAVANVISAGFGSVGYLLNMTGHGTHALRATAVATGTNVALNLVLTPAYGMIGVASATAASLILLNVLLWRMVRTRLGIRISVLGV